jgi:glutathione S-transferase
MRSERPIILYGFKLSGHSHRAELMLRLLDLPYEFRNVDLRAREQKREEFIKLNPFGTVPVIDDAGAVVADSVAILVYLARKYDPSRTWLPEDPFAAAQVERWLSAAQGPVYNGPRTARVIRLFDVPADYEGALRVATDFLNILDRQLVGRRFIIGAQPTIADVALYSYIACASEGGISLEPYGQVRSWLARIEALPNFEPMPRAQTAPTA